MTVGRDYFVYVACLAGAQIDVYRGTADAQLSHVQSVPLSGKGLPLAPSPDRRFLYASVIGEVDGVEDPRYDTFRIDATTGELTHIETVKAPARMAHIFVERSGRFLLGASFPGSVIASHSLGPRGVPQEMPSDLRPTPRKAHQIMTDLSNRFAYVPNLGADLVMQLRFDERSGRFADNQPPELFFGESSGPRHFAFHPGGRWAYLLNELDGSLVAHRLDPATGALEAMQQESALVDGFDAGEPWAAQIHVTPNGRFLYASERRASTLAGWRIDPRTGRLSDRKVIPCEKTPRGFDIDPAGRFLVLGGMGENKVAVYAIDPDSGALDRRFEIACGAQPNWVEVIDLP